VSRQSIYSYEHGQVTPHPDVMHRLARTLNLPEMFFRAPKENRPPGTVFYRSLSSATKAARVRAERRLAWLREIVAYLEEFVELPEPQFPDLGLPPDPLRLSVTDVEAAAQATRRYWGLGNGPISNVDTLIENHGAVVTMDEIGADGLDSLSIFPQGEAHPFFIVGLEKGSAVRWRFDLAHELAHTLLHRQVQWRTFAKPPEYKLIEEQAHWFSAAFLLPPDSFSDDLYTVSFTLDDLRPLKRKWKVSIGMMIRSARRAELISPETEKRLWMAYARRGWKRQEPLDDELEPEQPQLLHRCIELIVNEGVQTREDVLQNLPYSATDIETLASLPREFLSPSTSVAELRLKARPASPSPDQEAEVYQFPPDRPRSE
jgi:Zn-dependent peptidase ImmA (M78 family)